MPLVTSTSPLRLFTAIIAVIILFLVPTITQAQTNTIRSAQSKVIKIYGAGGIRGLEAYQSGFLISPDGHILTSFSYVLDTEDVIATLDDGRDFAVTTVGIDPRLEIALLKIEATELPYFDLNNGVKLQPGSRVLAFSNLFGIASGNEPASVLHGSVMAISKLSARRGNFQIPYQGSVYLVDAITNNPGAAGGALTNLRGELAGILGKELRSADANVWINYALPIENILESVEAMKSGNSLPDPTESDQALAKQPWTISQIGILLVPDILPRTPPFVETVHPASVAAKAGVQSDDLVMYIGTKLVRSYRELQSELRKIEDQDDLSITVLRNQKLIPLTLEPSENFSDVDGT